MKRALVSAGVLLGLLTAAGCSGSEAQQKPADSVAAKPPAVTASPTVSNLNDVSLPLDHYTVTVDQFVDLDYASKLLASDCMKRYGITWDPGTRLKLTALRDRSNRLGLVDEAVAKRAGYHADPARAGDYATRDQPAGVELTEAQGRILQGDRPGRAAGKDIPEGGCAGEGRRKVGWSLEDDGWLQNLTNEAVHRTFADKRTGEVHARWSACMAESGYRYAAPADAAGDRRWFSDEEAPASKAEVNTAVADVRCKKKINYIGTVSAILIAYQQQIVEQQAERLDAVRSANQEALKKAAAVLGGR